jgi:lactoylglutathione lyase
MAEARKARVVGLNHVALEVGDIDDALAFYGRLFDFKLLGKSGTSAFIDLGDQFLAGRGSGAFFLTKSLSQDQTGTRRG